MGKFANRRLGWKFVIRKPRKKVARFIVTGARATVEVRENLISVNYGKNRSPSRAKPQ